MKALFLGAGASYECGMPLVWEFTNILRANVLKRLDTKLFDLDNHPKFRNEFELILSNPDIHYEEMVGRLEYIQLKRVPESTIAARTARQLLDCIQVLLLEDQILTAKLLAEKAKDYSGLKSLVNQQGCLNVFSLNHDVNFEEICNLHGIECRDGFHVGEVDRYSNIANFNSLSTCQINSASLNYFGPGGCGVNLFKLHGSLDIFSVEDNNLYLKCVPIPGSPVGSHALEIQKVEQHSINLSQRDNLRTVGELDVIDAAWEIQFLRRSLLSGAHKFKGTFEQIAPHALFDEFQARIMMVKEVDVIGYGFGDEHINDVLKSWLLAPGVSLNIYDPYRKDIPLSFESAADKICIFNAGLTKYLHQFEEPKNPAAAHLRNQIFEQGRENLRRKRLAAWNADKPS